MLGFIGGIVFLRGLVGAAFQRKHFLSLLVVMEVVSLGLFVLLVFCRGYAGFVFMCVYYLVIASCFGALGISLLVSVVRVSGRSFVASLVFQKF